MMAGDFNEVLRANEKFGGNPVNRRRAEALNECLDNCNMLDLGFSGPRHTWTNLRDGNLILERIDRAWATPDWVHIFLETKVTHLTRTRSNHCPILVDTSPPVHNMGPRPFRFEPMWLSNPSFKNVVLQAWANCTDINIAINKFTLMVRKWNVESFGNILTKKRRILARLNGVQKALSHCPSHNLLNLEWVLSNDFNNILRQEEEFWATKSRVNWLIAGDRNTKFFHITTLAKRRVNKILGLRDTVGNWYMEQDNILRIIRNHFMNLFTTSFDCAARVTPTPNNFVQIFEDVRTALIQLVSPKEIKCAFFSMKPNKAPGPDGLHPCFYHNCWDILSDSVNRAIGGVFNSWVIPKGWN